MIRQDLKELYPLVYKQVIRPMERRGAFNLDAAWAAYDLVTPFEIIHERIAELLGVESTSDAPTEPWPVEQEMTPWELRDTPPRSVAMAELERRIRDGELVVSTGPRLVE